MVPGFVRLGSIAVLFQLLVVAAFYAYVRYRHPVSDPTVRTRAARAVGGGAGVVALAQLTALGAVGSLRIADVLSLGQATSLADAGVLVSLLGYVAVCGGFVIHLRTSA